MTGYEATEGHCEEFEPNTVRVLRILSSSVKNFRCCIAHVAGACFSRFRTKISHSGGAIPLLFVVLNCFGIKLESTNGDTQAS